MLSKLLKCLNAATTPMTKRQNRLSRWLFIRSTIIPRAHPIIKDWFRHISVAIADLPAAPPAHRGTPSPPCFRPHPEEDSDPSSLPVIPHTANGPRGSYSYTPPRTHIPHFSMMSIDMSSHQPLRPPPLNYWCLSPSHTGPSSGSYITDPKPTNDSSS
jgi:hypothetical protein